METKMSLRAILCYENNVIVSQSDFNLSFSIRNLNCLL